MVLWQSVLSALVLSAVGVDSKEVFQTVLRVVWSEEHMRTVCFAICFRTNQNELES